MLAHVAPYTLLTCSIVPYHCTHQQSREQKICTCMQIDNWNRFDVFQVSNLSKGTPLETVTLALFARHDLLEKLKIPYDRLQRFVKVSCMHHKDLCVACYTGQFWCSEKHKGGPCKIETAIQVSK